VTWADPDEGELRDHVGHEVVCNPQQRYKHLEDHEGREQLLPVPLQESRIFTFADLLVTLGLEALVALLQEHEPSMVSMRSS